jgi:hypothetical protein
MRCLPVLLLVFALARPVNAEPVTSIMWRAGGPRIRPNDNRVATLLLDGLRRSPSLATLVERIEANNVIVYLEMQPALSDRLAGCLTWIATTDKYRYVRASLNPDLPADTLIAAIGHELRHAVEIIDNPSVTGPASMMALYRRIGRQGANGASSMETEEARAAGVQVRNDLGRGRVAAAIPGGNSQISPLEWHEWYRQRHAQLIQ